MRIPLLIAFKSPTPFVFQLCAVIKGRLSHFLQNMNAATGTQTNHMG